MARSCSVERRPARSNVDDAADAALDAVGAALIVSSPRSRGRVQALAGPGWRGRRLLVASALLLFLAFPPFHLVFPSFVALVPLALFVEGLEHGPGASTKALRGGLLFGLLYFGLLVHWIVPALLRITSLAVAVYAAAVLLLAMVSAFACWALHRMGAQAGVPVWIGLPLAWTAGEWLRAHAPSTLAFPWLGLGSSLTGYPAMAGLAELVGGRGVTFWLALVNGLLAEAVIRRSRRARTRTRRWILAAAVVAAVPVAWGVWRADHLPVEPVASVVTVRTDFRARPGETLGDLSALRAVEAALATEGAALAPPDLIVLPEGTFRDGLDRPDLIDGLRATARRVEAPILFGVVRESNPGGRPTRHNSAALVGPTGVLGRPYDKRRLVPLVERLPFFEIGGSMDEAGAFQAGEEWTVLDSGVLRVGVLICYESSFPGATRALRRAGAALVANITSDAWFGAVGPFGVGVAQHEAHLVMRAIESRRGVVRSANLGPVGFVDPVGRFSGRPRWMGQSLYEPPSTRRRV